MGVMDNLLNLGVLAIGAGVLLKTTDIMLNQSKGKKSLLDKLQASKKTKKLKKVV